jgi:dTDP-4-dehydrorhamnose reductase
MRMARLLITGGSGYLGEELLRQAAQPPWDVYATYHTHRPSGTASFVPLDLRVPGAAADLVATLRPEIVIHTAYVQSGPDLRAITVDGAAEVARAARAIGARLVHMSSDVVFAGDRERPYSEEDQSSPVNEYGQAKAEAEHLVLERHPEALLVRTSLIYGGRTPSKHEQLALDAADGLTEIAFYTDEMRCPIAVADLAAALLELMLTRRSGPLHVAGGQIVSRFTFARLVAAAHGRDPARLRGARSADSHIVRPRYCALDSRLAQSLIRTRLRGATEVLSPS